MTGKTLYPLKFKSILKDKVWGGNRLEKLLNKKINSSNCGEIWELSTMTGDISVVENGPLKDSILTDLIGQYQADLVGGRVFEKFGTVFPLLVKFIDANRDLSIQVHPNDQQAKEYNSLGKSEMWYILHADENAELISGFQEHVSREQLLEHLKEETIEEVLHHEKVAKDDVYHMPAGRIHNIGSGMVIAEIQQMSDITYRIYDFNRADLNGKKRQLHVEKALEVLDFEVVEDGKVSYEREVNQLVNLVSEPYFTINKITFDSTVIRNYAELDSFKIYVCLGGEVELEINEQITIMKLGDVYLLPAVFEIVSLEPKAESILLEAYIE